jgi:hypothetical protein
VIDIEQITSSIEFTLVNLWSSFFLSYYSFQTIYRFIERGAISLEEVELSLRFYKTASNSIMKNRIDSFFCKKGLKI